MSAQIGYGIERCLYELNPGLPCQSPHLNHDYVTRIRDLLPALDETANRVSEKTLPIDRHIAAFIAEIVRSGIQAVSRGQIEAARSVGLGRVDLYMKVILPQALR
ncbi:MAG: ABC transporter permease subunit, partial [Rhodospirillales bacterium]|nr:ABC transporter permease subunit [Rhodospirillales bacterium]